MRRCRSRRRPSWQSDSNPTRVEDRLGLASLLLWAASLGFGWRLHQRSVAAELALAHREQRLRALMDSTADGIVLSAAERGARLISHLLAFSRRQPLAPKPVDVDALIAGLRELFDQSITETVDLGYRLNSRGWHAMVDPVQLESALLNLVINARQAMPDGGSLTIETRQLARSSLPDGALDLVPGEYVVISVSDTGCGIAPEHRDKVFEPFFTTKDVGEGSGLGLSMVHGFVKQSGGGIGLDSRVDEGTTIELFLPVAPARQETVVAETSEGSHEPGARILVVEDDPAVRTATVDLLDSLGHRVVEAGDGTAALDLLEKDPAPDLVLSDVVLPCGMDGYALASQVRMRYPGVRVLLMSGYPRYALAGADHSDIRLLLKPFTREQLRQAIGETMVHPP